MKRRLARGGGAPALIGVVCLVLAMAGAMAVLAPDGVRPASVAVFAVAAIAAPSFVAVGLWLGARGAARLLVLLALYAYGIEALGVRTGWPYGRFEYGDGLGPMFFQLVPATLPLAYVPLVLGAAAVANRWGPDPGTSGWVAVGVVTLLGCDLVLDPGAVAMGYWRFESGGPYYGVPVSNFAGWAVTGAVALLLVARGGRAAARPAGPWLSSGMAMTVAFYGGVGAASGLAVPAVLGAALAGLAIAAGRGGNGHQLNSYLTKADRDGTLSPEREEGPKPSRSFGADPDISSNHDQRRP